MTESDSDSIWSEWDPIQRYLEQSQRDYEEAIEVLERIQNQNDQIEEMIEQLHQTSLQELEERGECTFGDRIVEWIQKIDPSSKEERAECSSVTSEESNSLGQEEKPTISPH